MIILTVSEICIKQAWIEVCDLKGINIWALNEGLIGCDEEIEFTEEEARTLGFTQ